MKNFAYYGHSWTFKTPLSIYTDATNRVFTSSILLDRQHLSVKSVADSLIRRALISLEIFQQFIIFVWMKIWLKEYIAQNSKTLVYEIFRLLSWVKNVSYLSFLWSQVDERGEEHLTVYTSRILQPKELKLSVTEQKCSANTNRLPIRANKSQCLCLVASSR